LHSGLHDLAPFLGELVLEPLLIGGRRLMDFLELSLNVDNPLFLPLCMLQRVSPSLGPLCYRLLQSNQVVSDILKANKQVMAIHHG
jgi:hypothetical protein